MVDFDPLKVIAPESVEANHSVFMKVIFSYINLPFFSIAWKWTSFTSMES